MPRCIIGGGSRPLQRVVTDLAADVPFAQAMAKLVEHYGVLLGESTIRHIAEGYAHASLKPTDRKRPGRSRLAVKS